MLRQFQLWALTGIGALVMLTVLVNMALFQGNVGLQV